MEMTEMFGARLGQPFMAAGFKLKVCRHLDDGAQYLMVSNEGKWCMAYSTHYNVAIREVPHGITILPYSVSEEEKSELRAMQLLNLNWLAKNKSGLVLGFENKPIKLSSYWDSDILECDRVGQVLKIPGNLLITSLVDWENNEPYEVAVALKGEEK